MTYSQRQEEFLDELDGLKYTLVNAENKPLKLRDQQAIDAVKAQIADVQQRFKAFQEEAVKVAKENLANIDP